MHARPTTKTARRRVAQRRPMWAPAVPAPLRRWLAQELAPVAAAFRSGPVLALLAATVPLLLMAYQFAAVNRLDVGTGDDGLYLRGFHDPEESAGATFRWTSERAEIAIPAAPGNSDWEIALRLGSRRPPGLASPPVQVYIDDRLVGRFDSVVDFQDYRFRIARPAVAAENLTVRLVAETFDPAGDDDNRALGVAFDSATFAPVRRAGWQPFFPPPGHTLLVVASVGLLIAILARLAVDRRVLLGMVLALLAGIVAGETLWPDRTAFYLRELIVVVALLTLALLGLRPLIRRLFAAGGVALTPRAEDWLLRIVLFGAGLHLAGVIYPGFTAHDLYFQSHRVEAVLHGQFLLTTFASEFGNRRAPYPPALYTLAAPFAIIFRDATWPMRFLMPLLDATSAIMVCYLARRCRLPEPAPLLAAFFYTVMPATFQFLWWGFFSNLFGQWATLLALTLIVGHWGELRRPAIFWGVVVSLCLTLLSHPGTFVLSLALLPILTLALLIGERDGRRDAGVLGAALGIAVVIVFLIYYRHFTGLLVDQVRAYFSDNDPAAANPNSDRGWEPNYVRLRLFAFPFLLYFLTSIAAGIGLVRRRNRLGWTILAMLLTAAIFAVIHIAIGVWVRYFVFVAPALALGAGVAAAWAWQHGRLGRVAAYAATAYGTAAMVAFWFGITVLGLRSPYP